MTLDEILKKITEAENSIENCLNEDDFEFCPDYQARAQSLLQELMAIKPSLNEEQLAYVRDFMQTYEQIIKERQIKIQRLQQRITEQYRQTKQQHNVANKYSQIRKQSYN